MRLNYYPRIVLVDRSGTFAAAKSWVHHEGTPPLGGQQL